jgi:type II secretion system protein G
MRPVDRTNPPRRPNCRGFSLLELSLVLAIMGILIAVTAYSLAGRGTAAKIKATEASLKVISNSIKEYHLNHSAYPTDLTVLVTAKYIEPGGLKDAWNNDFLYDPRGINADQPFILGSAGPNGTPGDEDDIDAWRIGRRPN